MSNLHQVLLRQLKRVGCEDLSTPPTGEAWQELLSRISRSYTDADQDRYTVERSLDISSREMQALYARLSTEHHKLQSVISSIVDGLCYVDKSFCIKLLNPEAERLLGWSSAEAVGKDLFDVVDVRQFAEDGTGAGKPVDTAPLRKIVSGGQLYRNEDQLFVRRDGSFFPVAFGLNPMMIRGAAGEAGAAAADGGANMVGAVMVFRDISVRRRFEHDLRESRLAAEAASRAKSEFLANMSHEIRTPMNGVLGMTELLLGTELDATQRDYAETVRNSAESLLTILNDILDFSKIEAGKYDLESIEFDVRQAVEEVAVLLAEPVHRKGLELCCIIHHEVPRLLRGDPGRLRQILTNLIGNAVKFTDKGEIVIRVSVERDLADAMLVRFEVVDTGIGISAEGRQRLFASFSQVDASTTRKYGGTGLGLAISKRLAELMGGEIGVESEPGKGSTFWFSAKLGKLPQAASLISQPESLIDLRGRRVLVVDDNETNRKLMALLLSNWGMVCDLCEDAYRSLSMLYKAAGSLPYDFAIIDMQMPGMDGLELARVIRGDARFAALPVIMLTSLGERGLSDKARQSGISAYLSKPVRQSQLYDCLIAVTQIAEPNAGGEAGGGKSAEPLLITRHSLAAHKPQNALTVLVVEDNPVNQKVAVGMLRQLGQRAEVANNGREAIEAVASGRYGLLLMDCIMPELDGYEAAAAIRRIEQATGRRVPIVAMSSSTAEEDRRRELAAGMDDAIGKPLNRAELERVVQRFLIAGGDAAETSGAAAAAPAASAAKSRAAAAEAKPLVLVAEDNPINQRVAFAMLVQLGYRAEVVSTGLEALKSMEGKTYDAILMDCQMPEMDGYEATVEIRHREGSMRHTPIIAMTANAMQGDRERALASGMDDYLSKPVKPSDLKAILLRYTRPHGADSALVPPPAAAPSQSSITPDYESLDRETIGGLRTLVNDGGSFFRELVASFLSDLPTQIHGLRAAITASDARYVRECAHGMKGAAHNMGAKRLAELCRGLEAKARGGDLFDAMRLLGQIEREVARVNTAFKTLLS